MTAGGRSGSRGAPRTARTAARNLGFVALLCVVGGCAEDEGDLQAFCEAVADLERDDPFAELQVATPAEMRDAFAELGDAVDRIADAAPPEVGTQADRYADAVADLRGELAGAGYDLTRVDQLRYGEAVAAYTEGAVSVDNSAEALC